jgi:hypothetical protein
VSSWLAEESLGTSLTSIASPVDGSEINARVNGLIMSQSLSLNSTLFMTDILALFSYKIL